MTLTNLLFSLTFLLYKHLTASKTFLYLQMFLIKHFPTLFLSFGLLTIGKCTRPGVDQERTPIHYNPVPDVRMEEDPNTGELIVTVYEESPNATASTILGVSNLECTLLTKTQN